MRKIFSLIGLKPANKMTAVYTLGLVIITAVSIGSHMLADKIARNAEKHGTTINVAGKQRTWSQRSAYLVMVANQTGNSSTLLRLRIALDSISKAHDGLVNGNAEMGLTGEYPEEVRKIYFEGYKPLDTELRSYIATLNDFYDRIKAGKTIPASELAPPLGIAERKLQDRLDKVVAAYEKDARKTMQNLVAIQRFSIVVIFITLLAEAAIIFYPMLQRMKQDANKLNHAKTHDTLTDAMSRSTFCTKAEYELRQSQKHGEKLSVLLCDLDHFKKANEVFGAKTGDKLLRHFAEQVHNILGQNDIFGRVGGEEFAIVLPGKGLQEAETLADRVCDIIRNTPMKLNETVSVPLTTSIGVTDVSAETRDQSIETVLARADCALYLAKQKGRDRHETRSGASQAQGNEKLKVWTNAFSKAA